MCLGFITHNVKWTAFLTYTLAERRIRWITWQPGCQAKRAFQHIQNNIFENGWQSYAAPLNFQPILPVINTVVIFYGGCRPKDNSRWAGGMRNGGQLVRYFEV
jgi:hypothetical protein